MTARPDPFGLAFGPHIPGRFEAARRGLEDEGVDPFDRDAWVLSRAGSELLRELRPEGALGEGMAEFVALAHAGFLFWQQGARVATVARDVLDRLLQAPATAADELPATAAYYVEVAPRRVWGAPVPGGPAEPLDGWFAVARGNLLDVVAIFGLHPTRPGFSVVQAGGAAEPGLQRADGTPLFAPVLEGGAAAGLWSVLGAEELLELGWRVHRRLRATGGPAAGRAEVAA